ncbi:hypothetical protein IAD21_03487 [Abditibacteriota bacterium]|nr:hypothetical protein IAD21_03487 [Abditibacteriota bacterium]
MFVLLFVMALAFLSSSSDSPKRNIGELLSVDEFHGAGFDKVREVHVEEDEDYYGNPIYQIWILMDSSLRDEDFGLQKLGSMRDWAYKRAWVFGAEKITPSVRVRRQNEWPVEATV